MSVFSAQLGRGVVDLLLNDAQFQKRAKGVVSTSNLMSSALKTVARAATAALAGGAIFKTIGLANEHERVTRALTAALESNSVGLKGNADALQSQQTAVQAATRVGGDTVAQLQTMAINLGANAQAAQQWTKEAIGMATALGQQVTPEMIRYVAAAHQGEFTMLSRYIPALRTAQTEKEKLAIFLEFTNKGLMQEAALTATAAGQWAQLKNNVGDLSAAFGEFLSGPGQSVVAFLKDVVAQLQETADMYGKTADEAERAHKAMLKSADVAPEADTREYINELGGSALNRGWRALKELASGNPMRGIAELLQIADDANENFKQTARQGIRAQREARNPGVPQGQNPARYNDVYGPGLDEAPWNANDWVFGPPVPRSRYFDIPRRRGPIYGSNESRNELTTDFTTGMGGSSSAGAYTGGIADAFRRLQEQLLTNDVQKAIAKNTGDIATTIDDADEKLKDIKDSQAETNRILAEANFGLA